MTEAPIQEYVDILQTILEERGFTVGDKDNFEADVTLNVSDSPSFILIGSIRDDKSWGIARGFGQVFFVGGVEFNLADPNSFQQIGDWLLKCMCKIPMPYHFNP